MELRTDKRSPAHLKCTGRPVTFWIAYEGEIIDSAGKNLHQHMLCGIGVIHTKIEAFPCVVHKFELTSVAEKSDTPLFQLSVKRQMPFDPVWDTILQQCIPDPFKSDGTQCFFNRRIRLSFASTAIQTNRQRGSLTPNWYPTKHSSRTTYDLPWTTSAGPENQ